ncbi:hypothetical protein ACFOWM_12875 [Ferruginibacter yonginensis]|uniref:Peptidase C39-like domain-containing protein n=1 Tax=Ferruginibacter yonginensis TaxID=1310416 RepID=A0ABV8QVM4_9BACT
MDVEPNVLKNQSVSAFLEAPPNAPDAVKKVIKKLADMEATQPFLQDYINKKGMANWQKALVSSLSSNSAFQSATSGGDTTYVLAPIFLSDSNIVRSLISARVTGEDVFIKFLEDYQYRTLPTKATAQPGQLSKEDYAYYYFYFTNLVYGESSFNIKDTSLFKDGIRHNLQSNQSIVDSEPVEINLRQSLNGDAHCWTIQTNAIIQYDYELYFPDLDEYLLLNTVTFFYSNSTNVCFPTIVPFNLPNLTQIPNPQPTPMPPGHTPGWGVNKKFNKNPNALDENDENNNGLAPYDNTNYSPYLTGSILPNVNNVISSNDFIGWSADGISTYSIDYAKAQIAVNNYKISNYNDATGNAPYGQTYQIYNENTGVNTTATNAAIGYISGALQAGIPVVVGVDCRPGASVPSNDVSTDHFIVIVGMGYDVTNLKNYFQYYDCSTYNRFLGTSSLNKLFITANGKLEGASASPFANTSGFHNYIVTQVRRSKPL